MKTKVIADSEQRGKEAAWDEGWEDHQGGYPLSANPYRAKKEGAVKRPGGVITLANLKRYLEPVDRIEPGSAIFDRWVGGFIDPCVAIITFGPEVIRMHVNQSGFFRVGMAEPPMRREQLDACARARALVVKAGLYDTEKR